MNSAKETRRSIPGASWREILMLVFALSSAAAASASPPPPYSVLYVATNGNDAWDGLQSTPGTGGQGPLLTLQGARDKLRIYRAAHQLDPNTTTHVKILAGTYPMSQAVVFQNTDSGTVAAPVSFEAYNSTKPLFTGGQSVTTGTTCQTGGFCVNGGIWEVTRPEFLATSSNGWQVEQLYVNGRRATRARTPNRYAFSEAQPNPKGYLQHVGFAGFSGAPAACGQLAKNKANEWVSQTCFRLKPTDFALLSGLTSAQLHEVQLTNYDYWTISRHWIDSLDSTTQTVILAGKAPWYPIPPTANSRLELSGIPSALDAPGEFYVDRQVGKLRYFPHPGENPSTAIVMAPRMNTPEMISIQDASSLWVTNLSFHNLIFEDNPYLLRRTWYDTEKFTGGYVDGYGGFSLPATITVARGSDIQFDGLEMRHTGATAIWLRRDTEKVTIQNSYFHDLGGGGIKVVEYDPTADTTGHTNFYSQVAMGGQHVIRNNVVHSGGRSFYDVNGILLVMSPNNNVSHNEVGDFFNSGISTFSITSGPSHDNSVSQNRVHQIGEDLLSDLAAFYSKGPQPGQSVTNNQVFNVRHYGETSGQAGYGAQGIYFDLESTGTLRDNLAYDVESSGIFLGFSMSRRDVLNNVFAISEEHNLDIATNPNYIFAEAGNIEHNVFYSRTGSAGFVDEFACNPGNWNPKAFFIDLNLYWGGTPGSGSVTFQHPYCDQPPAWTWPQWQALGGPPPGGTDLHSLAGVDPLFANVADWNFTLDSQNPALQAIGFVPFLVAGTGVDSSSPYYSQRDELERPVVDFGGMYGFSNNGPYGNPLYNGAATVNGACPPGYTDSRAYGWATLDWIVGYCHRPKLDQPSLAEFGGMYVEGAGYTGFNQLANVTHCPAGFTPAQILGNPSGPYDPSVFYCYKAPASANPQWQFAGMFGVTNFTPGGYYLNPLDGRRAACRTGYQQYLLINDTPENKALYYCAH